MRVAALQMNSGTTVEDNLQQAETLVRQAVLEGAELVVLPENFAYLAKRDVDREVLLEKTNKGELQAFLSGQAKAQGITIVGGTLPILASGDDRPFSRCLVFNAEGKEIAAYDKIHLFDVDVPDADERYHESGCTRPGEHPVLCQHTGQQDDAECLALGLSVCYDLRFPELYRALVSQGAECLTVPAAFTHQTGEAHWQLLLRARAVENLAWVIGAGQTGTHPGGRQTWGHSMIINPWGEVLNSVSDEVGVVVAELDLDRQRKMRRHFPVLEHRQIT